MPVQPRQVVLSTIVTLIVSSLFVFWVYYENRPAAYKCYESFTDCVYLYKDSKIFNLPNYNVYSNGTFICLIVPQTLGYSNEFNMSSLNHTNCYLTSPINTTHFCQLYSYCSPPSNMEKDSLDYFIFPVIGLMIVASVAFIWTYTLDPNIFEPRSEYSEI
jgi:hypothetical protein